MRLHVVGTGLIGTSVGLALAGQAEVLLSDVSADHLARAVARGAGRPYAGQHVDMAIVCAPPSHTAALVRQLLAAGAAGAVSHVASQQSTVQAEVEAGDGPASGLDRFCGSHPLAGRERGGPDAATGSLFVDRPWVLCPTSRTSPAAERAVADLAEACGAVPVRATARDHDAAVALVSHLPQLAASAVGARLAVAPTTGFDPTQLAGPGVQDTTRIAASDPDLWVDVLTRNARHVAPLVRLLADDLSAVADALAAGEDRDVGPVLRSLLERGRTGRARLPLKRGRDAAFADVAVAVPDRPGQLAAVLTAAAAAGVNVEDVRVEHLPGRPRGLVALLVPATEAARAGAALTAAGWDVLPPG